MRPSAVSIWSYAGAGMAGACVLFLLLYAARHPLPRATNPSCSHCNVILISIDTFGAKHSTVYDSTKNTTPFLKELADTRAIVFEHAYSQAPWTLPSHTSMLTGRYPWDLNMWLAYDALPRSVDTLAELLETQGYQTAAFSDGAFVQPQWQFDQGFNEFRGSALEKDWNDLPQLLTSASAWSTQTHTPFFLFVRPFEIHDPYGTEITISDIVTANLKPGGPSAADALRFQTAYEEELRTTDSALRDFFRALDDSPLRENTVVIITSDHGEEFGEHGTAGYHSVTTYTEAIHVPLLIVLPESRSRRIPESVEVRSIPATILDILGLPSPEGIAESLLPLVRGTEVSDREVLSATSQVRSPSLEHIEKGYAAIPEIAAGKIQTSESPSPYRGPRTVSAILGRWHVIQTATGNEEEYDVYTDPNESDNVSDRVSSLPARDQAVIETLRTSLREL